MKDAVVAGEVEVTLTPEEQDHAAAVARGDVITQQEEETINPDFLAEIAKEAGDAVTVETKKESAVIPYARFNEVNEENKALKAQLEAIKVQPAAPQESAAVVVEDPREKIKELRRQHEDLRIEGDLEAASLIADQIDDLILQAATTQAESRFQQKNALSTVQTSMDAVAAKAYVKYPFLDVNSETVDSDAVNAVVFRRDELVAAGHSLVDALQAAVDEKGPKFARLLGIEASAAVMNAERVRSDRDKDAREKASEASLLQPAALPSRSEKDSFAVNVTDLTPAQIKAMPEEQKARMRGDIV